MQSDVVSAFQVQLSTGGKGDPLTLRSPVIAAAGCFPVRVRRWTAEDVAPLGAVCTPAVAMRTRPGGVGFAVEEAPAGVILCGRYPTISARRLREEIAPRWRATATPLIATVRATDADECHAVVTALAQTEFLAALELSLADSERGGAAATHAINVPRLVESVRGLWSGTIIVKLFPAVVSTGSLVEQLESAGADAISVGGGFGALASPLREPGATVRPGRLVGPATRPLALRQVAALCRATCLPVIAAGGVVTADDVLAFLAVGAVAVQVGSIALRSPLAAVEIARATQERLAGANRDTEPGAGAPTVIGWSGDHTGE